MSWHGGRERIGWPETTCTIVHHHDPVLGIVGHVAEQGRRIARDGDVCQSCTDRSLPRQRERGSAEPRRQTGAPRRSARRRGTRSSPRQRSSSVSMTRTSPPPPSQRSSRGRGRSAARATRVAAVIAPDEDESAHADRLRWAARRRGRRHIVGRAARRRRSQRRVAAPGGTDQRPDLRGDERALDRRQAAPAQHDETARPAVDSPGPRRAGGPVQLVNQGPIPATRSAEMRTTWPGGGLSNGGNRTPGPR